MSPVGKDYASERYQELQRLGWNVEDEAVPAPIPHWEYAQETIQHEGGDWMVYADGQEAAHILVERGAENHVKNLEEIR